MAAKHWITAVAACSSVAWLAACGHPALPAPSPLTPPPAEARDVPTHAYVNQVSEEPWWTATSPSPTPPPANQQEDTTVLVPSDMLFDVGSAQLSPATESQLSYFVRLLLSQPSAHVVVSGHTDSDGSEAFNQRLSVQRAQAVAAWLESQGIPTMRITARGFGETDPVAANDTAAHKALNRRVEITVQGVLTTESSAGP
jgi:OOP family OmpA-OmpF porin